MFKRLLIFSILTLVVVCSILFFSTITLATLLPLLPPFVAMGLAFITYSVEISLFIGVMVGAVITIEESFLISVLYAPLKVVDHYVVHSLASSGHVSIIIFTIFIGGLVSLIGFSGGMRGLVNYLSKYAKCSSSAQWITWAMGLLVFFDGLANTYIVGNTLRPICDKYKISREKLSFIVDSTSSPVTSLVIISTWIGYEIGLIGDAYAAAGIKLDPYFSFIYSLPFRFYVILMIFFIPMTIFFKKDLFSMARAELRARKGDGLTSIDHPVHTPEEFKAGSYSNPNPLNAVIPILVLLFGVIVGIIVTGAITVRDSGGEYTLISILGGSDSFKGLIWASFIASAVSGVMIIFQKIGRVKDVIDVWFSGIKTMLPALIILTLAWSMGAVLKDLKTAETVATLLGDSLPLWSLPVAVFFISAVISFATGTSWGTMAIIIPIVIPLVIKLVGQGEAVDTVLIELYLYPTLGSVLSGAVFGDHCSPISDTTILSSVASGTPHMDHVKTQMPYALLVAVIASSFGYLPSGLGFNPYLSLLIGSLFMGGTVYYFGKKISDINN